MLDWLKAILGSAYTEDIDKKVFEQVNKDFVSRVDFNAINESRKSLDMQIKERDMQLEELKKVDATGLQAKITELQASNTIAKSEFDKQLKAAQLEFKLDSRLMKEGAVNTKAVKALLDSSKISLDGDNLVGIDDQLKALKEREKWAFAEVMKDVPGAGGNPPPAIGANKTALPKGVQIF